MCAERRAETDIDKYFVRWKNEMKSAVPCTGRAYLNAGGPFQPNCGIIYPVSACEPQAKHELAA